MNERQLRSDAANYMLDCVNREFPTAFISCYLEAEPQLGFSEDDDQPDVFLYYWVFTLDDDVHNTKKIEERLVELSHMIYLQHGIFMTFRLRRVMHDSNLIQDEES